MLPITLRPIIVVETRAHLPHALRDQLLILTQTFKTVIDHWVIMPQDGEHCFPRLAGREPPIRGNVVADLTLGRLVCGTAAVVDGTYVWTDYAYDDTGASAVALGGGAAAYPDGAANAADLIQLQLRATADGLHIRAVLQTLDDPALPVLVVASTPIGDPTTGAATFPGYVWNACRRSASSSWWCSPAAAPSSAGSSRGAGGASAMFPSTVDTGSTMIETTVPIEHLDPSGATWRTFVAVGLAVRWACCSSTASARSTTSRSSGTRPWRGRGVSTSWQDRNQADILAGRYSSEHAAAIIDFDALHYVPRDDASDDALPPGYHTFRHWAGARSRRRCAAVAGVVPPQLWADRGLDTAPAPPWKIHAGRYQPYGVYIPERLPTPAPLVVFLHGTGSNHLAEAVMSLFGPGRFDLPAIVVSPLGRGGSCGYYGAAEQDVLDVMADIGERYAIDETLVPSSPGSRRAGSAPSRLGELYPDKFSR